AATSNAEDTPIEAAYLQLVMARLWDEEQRRESHTLRSTTFAQLGGAKGIVRTHFAATLGRLNDLERGVAQDVLRYLVTPGCSKIAQEPGSLAAWTDLPRDQIEDVLDRLATQEGRILRRLESPIPGHEPAFEIFHDVLARVVLGHVEVLRRQRNEAERQEAERRLREQEEANRRQLEANWWLRRQRIALIAMLVMTTFAVLVAVYLLRRVHEQARIAGLAQRSAESAQRSAESAQRSAESAQRSAEAVLHQADIGINAFINDKE